MAIAVKSILQHRVWALMLVLPMVLLSALPQGTMATRGAEGLEVVLCTGDGPLTILVDENGAPVDERNLDAADCGWWLLSQSLILLSPPGMRAPQAAEFRTVFSAEATILRLARVKPVYPARAPPLG